jgi:hypothetical protein
MWHAPEDADRLTELRVSSSGDAFVYMEPIVKRFGLLARPRRA